jgi:hypothetical protein
MALLLSNGAQAQDLGAQPAGPPTPRSLASIDLTGYWVAVISEDWRWRMIAPSKGGLSEHPDDAGGAEGGRRVGPGQGRSGWLDDTTLKQRHIPGFGRVPLCGRCGTALTPLVRIDVSEPA